LLRKGAVDHSLEIPEGFIGNGYSFNYRELLNAPLHKYFLGRKGDLFLGEA
jgi:hypothetical protein